MSLKFDPTQTSIKVDDAISICKDCGANLDVVVEMLKTLGYSEKEDLYLLDNINLDFDQSIDEIYQIRTREKIRKRGFEICNFEFDTSGGDKECTTFQALHKLLPEDLFTINDIKYSLAWPLASAIYNHYHGNDAFVNEFKRYMASYNDGDKTKKEVMKIRNEVIRHFENFIKF